MIANTPLWDDGRWTPLPALEGDARAEVCVIGLGGSGLSAIDELLAMGRSVIGIDAVDVAAGAAGRNGGLLLPGNADYHHDMIGALGHARARRLHALTVAEIARIAEQAPGTVRFNGSLRVSASRDEDGDIVRQRDAMRADGIEVEDYVGPMGRGIFMPGDAQFNPLARCRVLAESALSRDARLLTQTTARAFSGTAVVTDRGTIGCERVIVAVDGGLELLVPELVGIVRTARLQMLATAPTKEVAIPCPVSTRYGFDYWQQSASGAVALGGGRDIAMDDEWTTVAEPTERIQNYLEAFLREQLKVKAPITHRWAAIVSYGESNLPVLREVRDGVWAIGGYSGTGNVMGALAGRAVARLACGGTAEFATLLQPSTL